MKVKVQGRSEKVYIMQPGDWLGRDGVVRDSEGRPVSRLGECADRARYAQWIADGLVAEDKPASAGKKKTRRRR